MKDEKQSRRKKKNAGQEDDINIQLVDLGEDADIYSGALEDKLIRQVEDDPLPKTVKSPAAKKTSAKKSSAKKPSVVKSSGQSLGKMAEQEEKPIRITAGSGKKKKLNNRQFAKMTYAFVALFLAMMCYLVYFNMVRAKDIINSPYNARIDTLADRVARGDILDNAGNVLAETQTGEDGTETRVYPYGDVYAHVVGYNTNGKSGLESKYNFEMLTSNAFFLEKLRNEFSDRKDPGDNIITTLNSTLQQTAYDALGDNKGAAVVMEASTGKILAMVSKPTYDPNQVAANWNLLNTDPDSSLLNRATQGAYAPGSTFKIVTTLEYLRENPDYGNYTYDCNGEITYGDTTIHCYDGTAHGTEDLLTSFANSCNSSFANIGLGLNRNAYKNTAEDLLFNKPLPCPVEYRKSSFKVESDTADIDMMMTAMGQGETQVSPYHMVLITAAIANNGTLMKPYLVSEIQNYTGTTIKKFVPESYRKLLSAEEAAQLQEYMKAVVSQGTGAMLSGSSYSVAGKTGTAEYSSDKSKSHSWFVGYTNVDNPELVIAVVVESADDSGARAVPIAKEVLDSYYGQ